MSERWMVIRKAFDASGLDDDAILRSCGARLMEALRDRDRIIGGGYYVGAARLGKVERILIEITLAEPSIGIPMVLDEKEDFIQK